MLAPLGWAVVRWCGRISRLWRAVAVQCCCCSSAEKSSGLSSGVGVTTQVLTSVLLLSECSSGVLM
jgi:hypothetical protein